MAGHIIVTDDGSTRTITMRRPEKKNALTPEMFLAMSEAINSAQSNPVIRCLILTGRSGVFTAGDDVSDFVEEAEIKREVSKPRNAVIFVRSADQQPEADHRRRRRRRRRHGRSPWCCIATM